MGRGAGQDRARGPRHAAGRRDPLPRPRLAADGELRYYGSADATSWFLYVLAATGDGALADELRGAWERAGEWLLGALERGGGLVRWGPRPAAGGGLGQQGWRDADTPLNGSGGGILHEDGSVPPPPVADADTQAAAVAGLRGLAALSGSAAHARAARDLTERLAARFGPETMAIDGADRAVRGAGSQLGWLLWAGVPVGRGAAERLARARRAHRLRAAHAVRPPPAVRGARLPPRRGLAVRLVARLGRAARGGARRGGGARPRRRARRDRAPRRPVPRALRGHRRGPASGSRSPTRCRRGRSARSSRCAPAGTGGRRRSTTSRRRAEEAGWRRGHGGGTACCTSSIRGRSRTPTATASATCAGSSTTSTTSPGSAIDGLWLNPTFPSPNADWGFDVADYRDVHPDLGTLADLEELITAAGERGIRVLLDLVPNHTSDEHPWFVEARGDRDAPHRDWYVWRDPAPRRRAAEQLGEHLRRPGVGAGRARPASRTCTCSTASSRT